MEASRTGNQFGVSTNVDQEGEPDINIIIGTAHPDKLDPGKYNLEMPVVLAADHHGRSSKPATQYKARIKSCAQ